MVELSIRAVAVEELADLQSLVVIFREREDGSGHGIEVQRSLTVDPQDHKLGIDTYCISTSEGAAVYGGVTSCVLDGETLTIQLSGEAQDQLDMAERIRLRLVVGQDALDDVRLGLGRVFEGNEPTELRLS